MLRQTFQANCLWITFTYTVMLFEFILFALMPFLLGKAVDGLIENNSYDFRLYAGLSVVGLIVGILRRQMDTRVFMRIWKNQAVQSIEEMKDRGVDGSRIVSRYRLVGTFADFFESTLPTAIGAIVDICISLTMLVIALHFGGIFVFGCTIVAMAVYYYTARRIFVIDKSMQKLKEKIDEKIVIAEESVEPEFEGIRKDWVRRSDIEALSWGVNDMLWVVCEIFVVYFLLAGESSIGMVMATVVYVDRLFTRTSMLAEYFDHKQEIKMVKEVLEED